MLVDMGSGNAVKTRIVIDAILKRQRRLQYVPVDISEGHLHIFYTEVIDISKGYCTLFTL